MDQGGPLRASPPHPAPFAPPPDLVVPLLRVRLLYGPKGPVPCKWLHDMLAGMTSPFARHDWQPWLTGSPYVRGSSVPGCAQWPSPSEPYKETTEQTCKHLCIELHAHTHMRNYLDLSRNAQTRARKRNDSRAYALHAHACTRAMVCTHTRTDLSPKTWEV